MIDEYVQPDSFTPLLHTLPDDVRKSLNQFLEIFKSQFAQDDLTKMQIDMGDSEPVLQRPYPVTMKNYNWVRSEMKKLIDAQVIHNRHSSIWLLSL